MPRPFSLCALCFLLFNLLLPWPASAQMPRDHAAVVAPFIDEHTLAIGHVDLKKLDAAAAIKALAAVAPDKSPEFTQRMAMIEQTTKGVLASLAGAGISDLYIVVSLSDVPQGPPMVIAPLQPGTDAATATGILKQITKLPESEVIGGAAVAGSKETLARLKTLKATPRPELRRAFERAGDSAAQLVFWPSDDTRRVLREMLPRLPEELGGGSGKMLADGVQWGAIWADAPPNLKLAALVQSKDADAAAALRGMIVSSLQHVGKQKEIQEQWPEFGQLAALLTPRLVNDQLVLNLDERQGAPEALKMLAKPIHAARQAAARSQSTNNLKHLAIAMHNYHDSSKQWQFPPQAIRSRDGKPLLSWRVAILPYLDQKALYDQFHLDEPWDSEHNKPLIKKMPAMLGSPNLGDALIANGMTSYLVPLSRAPAAIAVIEMEAKPMAVGKDEMVFDSPHGTSFAKMTDGTSNTIMILEAHPKAAVVWTKPDDLVIDEKNPLQNLTGQPGDGFNVAFGDGSLRFIRSSLDTKVFWNLLRMNDGNVVGEF